MTFSMAKLEDGPDILDIYRHYVLNTAITFEYEPPSLMEMENRMKNIQAKYPYVVAREGNRIAGYAYASDFRTRAAYQWSPESTIYLHPSCCGKGIGKLLYQKLFDVLAWQGYYNVFAGIALPNEASVALHQKLGFREVGVYENIGYKFGKWHSTQWFQLVLKPHAENPASPRIPDWANFTI